MKRLIDSIKNHKNMDCLDIQKIVEESVLPKYQDKLATVKLVCDLSKEVDSDVLVSELISYYTLYPDEFNENNILEIINRIVEYYVHWKLENGVLYSMNILNYKVYDIN